MRNTNRDWTTITPKTLHQARIGEDIKRSIRTLSIITGKSILFNASTISLPIPFHAKIYSTKTAPASNDANQPETAVTTGFKAFLSACLNITVNLLNPLAVAVLT